MAVSKVLELPPHVKVFVFNGGPSCFAEDVWHEVDNMLALQASQSKLGAESKKPPLAGVPKKQ